MSNELEITFHKWEMSYFIGQTKIKVFLFLWDEGSTKNECRSIIKISSYLPINTRTSNIF